MQMLRFFCFAFAVHELEIIKIVVFYVFIAEEASTISEKAVVKTLLYCCDGCEA